MSPQTALIGWVLFILWCLAKDRSRGVRLSPALWIVVAWVFILATRPVSVWLGQGTSMETTDDYLEGSPLDRNVFLGLLVFGVIVLVRRRLDLRSVISKNKWVFLYYLFFALSALWSDYSFVSIKRLIKDSGNLVMVLIVLSDKNPLQAVKGVFFRCACLFVPLSVVLIKYYPDLGRGYDRWTWEPIYQGAALGKNLLGSTLVVCGLFVFWDLLQLFDERSRASSKIPIYNRIGLIVMVLWLLMKSNSATSLACTALGSGALLLMRLPMVKARRRNFVAYGVIGTAMILILSAGLDFLSLVGSALGRDSTLTGRTDIWKMVLAEKTNPLIGEGFYSFWLGKRVESFWEHYTFHVNQAHNGYLETYLDGGIIGVALLVAMLVATGKYLQKQLVSDMRWGSIAFIFWLIIMIHNWTEASFSRLSLLWFVLLLVSIQYSRPRRIASVRIQDEPDARPQSHSPRPAHAQADPRRGMSGVTGVA